MIALGILCNPTILAQDVALFEHNDYGGRAKTFSGDTAWVGDDFNDITSSLKVSPGYCVILYENMNYVGRSKQFCQDTPFVGDGFNDTASSFRVVLSSSINTKLAEDWFNRGMNLSNQSKYGDALVAFDKAIELNPQYADAWRSKGIILNCLGKYDESLKAWNKVIEIDPQNARNWANKGFSLYGQSKYEDAANAYDKATQLDPRLAEAWVGRGFALLVISYFPSASLDSFDRAISLDSNDPLAWIGKRDAYATADAVEKAVQLNPSYATEILSDTSTTLSFQREVFLKESCAQNPGK